MRKRFQGLRNVVRFNWPYYAGTLAALIVFGSLALFSAGIERRIAVLFVVISVLAPLISIIVTAYVYDLSGFYELEWLNHLSVPDGAKILNINAGFNETSELITNRFPSTELIACDFYDPNRHTEASIARARRAYPPFKGTMSINTGRLPFDTGSMDVALAILSVHEIRDRVEREAFLSELFRTLNSNGELVVVEHLRDTANTIAYTFGAWHFHSRSEWLSNFQHAGFKLTEERKLTPFVSAFFLEKNGTLH
jgi:SAM-dependent methyltransferase